jgi:hypothetical protein
MDKSELLKLAGQYFISDTGLSVANLVRKIQLAEGHTDCFSTGRTRCDQMACRWRAECLSDASSPASEGSSADLDSEPGLVGNVREIAK